MGKALNAGIEHNGQVSSEEHCETYVSFVMLTAVISRMRVHPAYYGSFVLCGRQILFGIAQKVSKKARHTSNCLENYTSKTARSSCFLPQNQNTGAK